MILRADLAMIAAWVPKGAHVLDLGCGNGELLRWLAQEKGCSGYGVEINHQAVEACVRHGVNVVQANIDEGLSLFSGTRFDVVVLSQALQATHQTERVLKDIAGLGQEAIVSIPTLATSAMSGLCYAVICPSTNDCPTSGMTPLICTLPPPRILRIYWVGSSCRSSTEATWPNQRMVMREPFRLQRNCGHAGALSF